MDIFDFFGMVICFFIVIAYLYNNNEKFKLYIDTKYLKKKDES